MARFAILLMCSLTFVLNEVTAAPALPPVDSPIDFELETNKTIDELLTQVNLGVQGVSSYGDGGEKDGILVELDMMLTPEQFDSLYSEEPSETRVKRKATSDVRRRWPNAQLVYNIDQQTFSPHAIYHIKKAMTEIEFHTCVSFRERRSNDRNWVTIFTGNGCWSYTGMLGGEQKLSLRNPGCRYSAIYVHELLHALGLVHEHQLPNRDDYLYIYKQNALPKYHSAFNKYSSSAINTYGVEYDFGSIMHYSTTAFSSNGQHTLYPKNPDKAKYLPGVPRTGSVGYSDVKILNRMYQCASHCPNQNKCTADGHLDQNCNCICKDGSQNCDTTKEPDTDQSCRNSHYNSWECYAWASEGKCSSKSHQCAKACGLCGNKGDPLGGECKDVYKTDRCRTWKNRGECVTNAKRMYDNCRATCNFCNGIDARRQENNCGNVHGDDWQCNSWALRGECQINPGWMLYNCAKSCLTC